MIFLQCQWLSRTHPLDLPAKFEGEQSEVIHRISLHLIQRSVTPLDRSPFADTDGRSQDECETWEYWEFFDESG